MTSLRFTHAAACSALLHGSAVALLLVFSFQLRSELTVTPALFQVVRNTETGTASPPGVRVSIPRPSVRTSAWVEPSRPATSVSPPVRPPTVKPPPASVIKPSGERVPAPPSKPKPGNFEQGSAQPVGPSIKPSRVDTKWDFTSGPPPHPALIQTDGGTARAGTELEAYFAELQRRLRAELDIPPGVSAEIVATVEVFLSAEGKFSEPRLVGTSGSAEFDQAVIAAIRRTRMGPRPDGRSESITIPFSTRLTAR